MSNEKMSLRWNGTIGPSFIAVAIQTVGAAVAVTMIYASLQNTVTNTKQAADRLETVVHKQAERSRSLNDRLIVVETSVKEIAVNVSKMSDKLDGLRTR